MKSFTLYIKSHTEAPDWEQTVQADKMTEAVNMFYDMLEGEFDMEFIRDNIVQEQ